MRKVIAAVLDVVLAVPLILAALILLALSSWVLDRGFYLRLVSDERLYTAFLDEGLPPALERAKEFVKDPYVAELDGIPPQVLAPALREVLTPAYLRGEAVRLVNEVFDALEGRRPVAPLALDLAPLKESLAGEAGGRFARTLAAALPVCAAGQAPVIAGGTLPRCRPPQANVEQTAARIRADLPRLLERFPDRYPLEPREAGFAGETAWYRWGPPGIRWLPVAAVIIALIGGGVLVGASFLAGRNRREVLQWLGWPLAVPAALVFLSGLAILLSSAGLWWVRRGPLPFRHGWMMREVPEVGYEIARTVIRTVSHGFLASGGVALALAVGLLVAAYTLPPREP
jgi:hypothetical protein